jgi:hypothetical protein
MIDPKTHKPPKPKTVVGSKSSGASVVTTTGTISSSLQDKTREHAYELYESRGREPGHDEEDWLRAEQEILKRER